MGWTVVRRNNRQANEQDDETTYFVTNVPREATKGEIRKVFERFGRVSDVWMGTNIGKNGKHYAFLRFTGVKDTKEMEKQIDGTKIRGKILEVNIAIHGMRDPPRQPTRQETRKRITEPQMMDGNKPSTFWKNSSRDHRSYADLMRTTPTDNHPPPGPPLPTPIILQREPETHSWLRKTALVGEATSLNHLGHLPKLIFNKGEAGIEIKYIGGLMVLILFDWSVNAKKFMEDESRWREHLKWLKWGEKANTHFERVAWIRIVGLPLHLWGHRNFEAISKGYGITIAPYDDIPNRVDLSHAKIGILTSRRARINDEIHAAFEGIVYKLGVIEFDEDWFPFRFDPTEDFLEGRKAAQTVNTTPTETIEMEEGEVVPETQPYEAGKNQGKHYDEESGGKIIPTKLRAPAPETATAEEAQKSNWEATMEVDPPRNNDESAPPNRENSMHNGPIPIFIQSPMHAQLHNGSGPSFATPRHTSDTARSGLPPIHCFGPFPSPTAIRKIKNKATIAHPYKAGESNGNRRRIFGNKSTKTPQPTISSMADLSTDPDPFPTPRLDSRPESLHPVSYMHPLPEPNIPPHMTPLPDSPIDLNTPNAVPTEPLTQSVDPGGSTQIQTEEEIEIGKTAEIGREIGFHINTGDHILRDAMGINGENNVPQ
ncbi:hypothetical protein LXL04_001275 [Taraxacum kok-saghyz]